MSGQPTKVAVLGAGIMGRGIARVFAAAGSQVSMYDISQDVLSAGLETLARDTERSVGRGDVTDATRTGLLDRIQTTTVLGDAVEDAPLVVEAAPERLELKRQLFAELDTLTQEDVILGSNTSALSVTSIASAAQCPERVIGLHFFNPVHRMDLVEVVIGAATSRGVVERSLSYCQGIGKTTIQVADRAGFATSRINATIGNEAFAMLMEGVASAEDIDTGMKLALNHPMGPFELVDLVGLDTRLSVLQRLHASLGERFRPNPLLVNLVEAGRLGRKTAHGVYRYDERGNRIPGSATIGDRPEG